MVKNYPLISISAIIFSIVLVTLLCQPIRIDTTFFLVFHGRFKIFDENRFVNILGIVWYNFMSNLNLLYYTQWNTFPNGKCLVFHFLVLISCIFLIFYETFHLCLCMIYTWYSVVYYQFLHKYFGHSYHILCCNWKRFNSSFEVSFYYMSFICLPVSENDSLFFEVYI